MIKKLQGGGDEECKGIFKKICENKKKKAELEAREEAELEARKAEFLARRDEWRKSGDWWQIGYIEYGRSTGSIAPLPRLFGRHMGRR
jgi:hypothetical protein